MPQPGASSNRPEDILETFSALLYKASPGLVIFGNLISLVRMYFEGEAVFTHNHIMFNILIVVHAICFNCLRSTGQSQSSNPSTPSTTDREL
jgi:hypothetical protein